MPATDPLPEFRTNWLPNVSDDGLSRLLSLLESGSPLLIRGSFTRAVPMGCLASHIAWNHPTTCDVDDVEAGITWLTRVARLNPATSTVILAWDNEGDHELIARLLSACREEQARRMEPSTDSPLPECVTVE